MSRLDRLTIAVVAFSVIYYLAHMLVAFNRGSLAL